jgi:hypothetical protein
MSSMSSKVTSVELVGRRSFARPWQVRVAEEARGARSEERAVVGDEQRATSDGGARRVMGDDEGIVADPLIAEGSGSCQQWAPRLQSRGEKKPGRSLTSSDVQ